MGGGSIVSWLAMPALHSEVLGSCPMGGESQSSEIHLLRGKGNIPRSVVEGGEESKRGKRIKE